MIWIVDGTRLKHDYPRFFKSIIHQDLKSIIKDQSFFALLSAEDYLPKNWFNRTTPVFFDFMGINDWAEDTLQESIIRKIFWCLLPQCFVKLNYRNNELPILIAYDKQKVIQLIKDNQFGIDYNNLADILNRSLC